MSNLNNDNRDHQARISPRTGHEDKNASKHEDHAQDTLQIIEILFVKSLIYALEMCSH